jgi:transposase
MVVALQHCQRYIPGPLIIIWDRLSAHWAAIMKASLTTQPALEVEWLPPYAPDRNPEEGCHGNVKQHLRHATPTSISDLRAKWIETLPGSVNIPTSSPGFFGMQGSV